MDDLIDQLGGNVELVHHCLEFLSLADLRVVRCVSRELSTIAREAVQSHLWLSQPANREALQLACWTEGAFTQRSYGHTALADVFSVCVHRHVLASGGLDRRALLWNLQTRECVSLMHTSSVRCVAVHEDNLVTGCDSGHVRLYSVRRGRLRGEV